VKTKRPTSIKVNYLNQQGEEKEQILQGFPARVFCHEYEHLLGIPFIDWKVSLGEIEVIEGFENSYENLIQVFVVNIDSRVLQKENKRKQSFK